MDESHVENSIYGIRCPAWLRRSQGKWLLVLMPNDWLEEDLKRELEAGTVFELDKDTGIMAYTPGLFRGIVLRQRDPVDIWEELSVKNYLTEKEEQ